VHRLLPTPARLAQQATNMVGMVVHAEWAPDHVGHPPRRPDVAAEAVRLGAGGQVRRDLRALLGGQARGPTGLRPRSERLRTALLSPFDPLADRGAADAQGGGDVLLPPPVLV
jgi:hypothetical protein